MNFGCKKNDSNPVSPDLSKNSLINSISGKLNDWNYYTIYQVSIENFGTGRIDINGNFEITNIAAPSDAQLYDISKFFGAATTLPQISDTSVKFYLVTALNMAKVKNPGTVLGTVQSRSLSNSQLNFSTSYVYFDKEVKINGTATMTFTYGDNKFYQDTHFNNLTFEKGWNKIVSEITSYGYGATKIEILQKEPIDYYWSYTDPVPVVTIADPVLKAGLKFPFCVDSGYKRCAAIYTAKEINHSGVITKLSWKALTQKALVRPITIYLKEVNDTNLFARSLDDLLTNATKVFSGSVTLLQSYWNWNDFKLPEPFAFSGNKNLLVVAETDYSGTGVDDDCYFEYSERSFKQCLTWAWNNKNTQILGTPTVDRPNIKIAIDDNY